tara:strand:- start:1176 stop:1376 length:201 start_codon:yes stop_codon:yes gene_type:complete
MSRPDRSNLNETVTFPVYESADDYFLNNLYNAHPENEFTIAIFAQPWIFSPRLNLVNLVSRDGYNF